MLIEDLAKSNEDYVKRFEQMKLAIECEASIGKGAHHESTPRVNSDPPESAFTEYEASSTTSLKGIQPLPYVNLAMKEDIDEQTGQACLNLLLGYYHTLMDNLLHEVNAPVHLIPAESRSQILKDIASTNAREKSWVRQKHKSGELDDFLESLNRHHHQHGMQNQKDCASDQMRIMSGMSASLPQESSHNEVRTLQDNLRQLQQRYMCQMAGGSGSDTWNWHEIPFERENSIDQGSDSKAFNHDNLGLKPLSTPRTSPYESPIEEAGIASSPSWQREAEFDDSPNSLNGQEFYRLPSSRAEHKSSQSAVSQPIEQPVESEIRAKHPMPSLNNPCDRVTRPEGDPYPEPFIPNHMASSFSSSSYPISEETQSLNHQRAQEHLDRVKHKPYPEIIMPTNYTDHTRATKRARNTLVARKSRSKRAGSMASPADLALEGRSSPNPHVVGAPMKHQCWDHGCNGRLFTTPSGLLRHQQENSDTLRSATSGHESTGITAGSAHECDQDEMYDTIQLEVPQRQQEYRQSPQLQMQMSAQSAPPQSMQLQNLPTDSQSHWNDMQARQRLPYSGPVYHSGHAATLHDQTPIIGPQGIRTFQPEIMERPRKRGRPSKTELEHRARRATEDEQVYPRPERTQDSRQRLEGPPQKKRGRPSPFPEQAQSSIQRAEDGIAEQSTESGDIEMDPITNQKVMNQYTFSDPTTNARKSNNLIVDDLLLLWTIPISTPTLESGLAE